MQEGNTTPGDGEKQCEVDEKSQRGRGGIKNASSQTAFVSAGGCDKEVEDEEEEELHVSLEKQRGSSQDNKWQD